MSPRRTTWKPIRQSEFVLATLTTVVGASALAMAAVGVAVLMS